MEIKEIVYSISKNLALLEELEDKEDNDVEIIEFKVEDIRKLLINTLIFEVNTNIDDLKSFIEFLEDKYQEIEDVEEQSNVKDMIDVLNIAIDSFCLNNINIKE